MLRKLIGNLDLTARQTLRGASSFFLFQLLGVVFTFLFSFVAARFAGPSETGLYLLSGTILAIVSFVATFALDAAAVRRVAASASSGAWAEVRGFYRRALRLALAVSCSASLVVFVAAPWLAEHVFADRALNTPMRILALAIVPTSLLTIHLALLRALDRVGVSGFVGALAAPVVAIIILLSLWFAAGTLDATLLSCATLSSTIVICGAAIWSWFHVTPEWRGVNFDPAGGRKLISESASLLWIGAATLLWLSTDQLVIGMLLTSDAVGVYGIAARVAQYAGGTLVMALGASTGPRIAALYAKGDLESVQRAVQTMARFATVLTLPVILALVFRPDLVLGIFGEAYQVGQLPLVILCLCQLASVFLGPVGTLLTMTGHRREMSIVLALTGALNLGLNFVFIRIMGIAGAALATLCTLVLANLVLARVAYKRMGIVTIAFFGRNGLHKVMANLNLRTSGD